MQEQEKYFKLPFRVSPLFIKTDDENSVFLWSGSFSNYFKTLIVRKLNGDKNVKFNGVFKIIDNAFYFNTLRIFERKGVSFLMDKHKLQPNQAYSIMNSLALECLNKLNE